MIRLAAPQFGADEKRAVQEVLSSGNLVQGFRVREFEELVAERVGSSDAIALSSGTAALHATLLSLGIGAGDVVVVPAFSFIATANAVELCGARPVFVDIDSDTFNMDPQLLESRLGELGSRHGDQSVKAILPVHAFGRLADMEAILRIANDHGVSVVEDAACALGASSSGRQAGTWGKVGCFSLHPRKVITTGEGGVVVTGHPEIARVLRMLRNHGQDPIGDAFDSVMLGYNYRMTEIQAAIGIVQIKKLDQIVERRQAIAQHYDEELRDTALTVSPPPSGGAAVYQSYVVLLPGDLAAARRALIDTLRSDGIEISIGTWHMPMTTYFRKRFGYTWGQFPVTDDVSTRAVSLPMHEGLTSSEQTLVIERLLAHLAQLTPERVSTLTTGRR
jgi:perosamine synthetase